MAETFIAQIQQDGDYRPFSEEDRIVSSNYSVNQLVTVKVSGLRKHRAYIQLKCYKGSCSYIADQNINKNMDMKEKVDYITKVKLGFIKGTFVDPFGNVGFIPDSLAYANCDHPRATKFINDALEYHASLVGIDSADEYVSHLRQLGQGYDR
jgi:hypothetical protein